MSTADLRLRLGVACAMGGREYGAVYSRRVLLSSVLPRAVLQVLFLALLGRVGWGEAGERFAFVGAVGYVVVTATVVRLPDVLVLDKDEGTFFRLRTGVLPPVVVALCRSWVYLAEAAASVAVSLAIAGPVLGLGRLALDLLPLLPLFAVGALSCLAFGLAGATLAVGRRADVLVGNALAYLLLVCAAVVAPVRVGWIDALGQLLPLRHVLAAVRGALDGGAVAGPVLAEVAVGTAWLAVAVLAMTVQDRRSRRWGIDDFS